MIPRVKTLSKLIVIQKLFNCVFSDSALVLYMFSSDKQVQDLFINSTRAGSMCINDTIMQYSGKIENQIGNIKKC